MRRTLGVNTWVWASPLTNESLVELARRAVGIGFEAIELPLENPGDWDPALAADVVGDLGLVPIIVGAMGPGRSLVSTAGDVDGTLDYLRTCITAAQRTGSAVVAGPFYSPTGVTWRMSDEDRAAVSAELCRGLEPLAAEAAAAGVTLAIEPLNRYETSLLNTVDQALDALGPLIGPGLGLALDTFHMNIEEKCPADAIRRAGSAIAHVQVCGTDRGAVGSDHTDWASVLNALDDASYTGVLGLESFTGENATIAVAASIWRPLAPSQDELARLSFDYLNTLQTTREALINQ